MMNEKGKFINEIKLLRNSIKIKYDNVLSKIIKLMLVEDPF